MAKIAKKISRRSLVGRSAIRAMATPAGASVFVVVSALRAPRAWQAVIVLQASH